MAITETRIFTRPDTTVDFHYNTSTPTVDAVKAALKPYNDSGAITSVFSLSEDGLTRTAVTTLIDLTSFAIKETIALLALDAECVPYDTEHNHQMSSYSLTGIDAPFTYTNVYTFPSAGLSVHDALIDQINNKNTKNLTNLTVTDTIITVIHTYSNSENYTENYWLDFNLAPDLHSAGVTRTITCAMV
jgi:hypothetical protein